MLILGVLIVIGLGQAFFGDSNPVPFDAKAFDGTLESGGRSASSCLKGFPSGGSCYRGGGDLRRRAALAAGSVRPLRWWMGVRRIVVPDRCCATKLLPEPRPHGWRRWACGAGNGPGRDPAVRIALSRSPPSPATASASSIIAKDGYLPRQLSHRGDRLEVLVGIIMLAPPACWCANGLPTRRSRSRGVHCRSRLEGYGAPPPQAGMAGGSATWPLLGRGAGDADRAHRRDHEVRAWVLIIVDPAHRPGSGHPGSDCARWRRAWVRPVVAPRQRYGVVVSPTRSTPACRRSRTRSWHRPSSQPRSSPARCC